MKQFVGINALKNPFLSPSSPTIPLHLSVPRYAAVKSLRLHGQLSRTSIAELTGYSPSRVTGIINELLDEGILVECDNSEYTGGRRAKDLYFNPDFGYIVAVIVGTDSLDVALAGFDEEIRIRRLLPIQLKDGPGSILNAAVKFVSQWLDRFNIPLDKVYGVGITLTGAVDYHTMTPYESPELSGWGGYKIDSFFRELFPYAIVIVDRDTNAMAFGELRRGAGRQHKHFLYVNIGNTINTAIIVNGAIYRGASGRAGDISLMLSVPEADKESQYQLSGNIHPDDIAKAALNGDTNAQKVIDNLAEQVGQGLATLVNLIDPEMILLGGSAKVLGHPFLALVRRRILGLSQSYATQHLQVDLAPLGREATAIGVIALTASAVFVAGA